MMGWNLSVLEWIQSTRTPFWDGFFSAITWLGEETILVPVFCVLFWCIHKSFGYRVSFAFFTGTFFNQLLKITFCIPRPWLLSQRLAPVEGAVEGATGYSFPSGHVAGSAGIYGGIAWGWKKWAGRISLGLLVLLIAYSRLYLGVHTPLDVGVSLLLGILLLAVASGVMNFVEKRKNGDRVVLFCGGAACLAGLLYALVRTGQAEDATLYHDAFKAVGGGLGYFIAWFLETRTIRFKEKAPLWFQGLKAVTGVLLLLLLQQGLKTPLTALLGEEFGHFLRYFLVIFFAIAGFPWLFTRMQKRFLSA